MKFSLILSYIIFPIILFSQHTYNSDNFTIGATLNLHELNTDKSNLFLKDFKYLTPANAAKQTVVHPRPNVWNWNKINKMLDFANLNNLDLRIHSPVGPQSSKWIKDDSRTSEELMLNLVEFMTESSIKFSNEPSVKWMDVVNETILPNGTWHGPKVGNDKWENPWLKIGLDENDFPIYILKSFEIATKLAPNISLVFNQNAGFQKPLWKKLKNSVKYIRSKGYRVDGIGWQGHLLLSKSTYGFVNKLEKGIKDLSNLIDWAHENDLDFHITELDYFISDKSNLNQDLIDQKIIYSKIINLLKEKSKNGVVTLNFWDIGERYKKGKGFFQSIYSKDLKPNPSYELISNILK